MPCVHEGRTGSRSRENAHDGSVWFTATGGVVEQQVVDGPTDPLRDRVRGLRGVDDHEPTGFGDGHLEEPVPDPAMECDVEAGLEPGSIIGRLARKADLDRQVEQDRQVGLEAARRDLLERRQLIVAKAAAIALVGAGRVGEPGADDRDPGRQRRLDDLLDQLAPSGVEEEGVRERVDRRVRWRQEQLADALAEDRPARLARPAHGNTASAKGRLEARRLGRLAGTLRALDRDEATATRLGRVCHRASVRPDCEDAPQRPVAAAAVVAADERARSADHPSGRVGRTLADMGRRLALRLLTTAVTVSVVLLLPVAAAAHPLGNFTINHYAGLVIAPDRIDLDIVIDMAEIPAFQERQNMDVDGDGSVADGEAATWAVGACSSLVSKLDLRRDGAVVRLDGGASSVGFPSGAGGLSTLRLECDFSAALVPGIDAPVSITFADTSYTERLGWREIVATGNGTILDTHGLPTTSPSQKLTVYPADMIAIPLDTRKATIDVRLDPAGPRAASPSPASVAGSVVGQVATNGLGGQLAEGAVPGGVAADLPDIFRTTNLTPLVILASLLTALVIGAGHALTPGHGKTLMAAYLVGSRGTAVHAVGLGLSVAVSHTLGIFALAFIVVGAGSVLPPDVVYRVTPVIAGGSIVAIGGWMLFNEVRRRRARLASRSIPDAHALAHAQGAGDGHAHEDSHEHVHEHGGEHAHDHGSDHVHRVEAADAAVHDHAEMSGEHSHGGVRHSHLPAAGATLSWRGLFVLGLAGGLIPSTSALIILLGSIAAGRPAFGLVLVVAFGLGMAAVMTGVGLAMIVARTRLDRMPSRSSLGRLAAVAPLVASVAVLGLGLVLTWQAVAGRPVL